MSETNINVTNEAPNTPVIVSTRPLSFRQFVGHAAMEFFQRMTSRKLWMVIFACAVPWLGLERGVNHLYALQQWQAAVYGSMFLAVMGGIVAIVCKYMGIDNVSVSAATSVTGAIQAAASHAFERREEQVTSEHTEHIIEEGAPGAPAVRPFTTRGEEPDNG